MKILSIRGSTVSQTEETMSFSNLFKICLEISLLISGNMKQLENTKIYKRPLEHSNHSKSENPRQRPVMQFGTISAARVVESKLEKTKSLPMSVANLNDYQRKT